MAELSITGGPNAGRRVSVTSEMVIGRAEGDVLIDDPEVSRRHAAVRPAGEGLEIEDLGSTNGTIVNGRRIQGIATISPGAVIRLGQTTLELERIVAPTAESPAVPIHVPSLEREPSTDELPSSIPPGHRPLPLYRESRRGWVVAVLVVLVLLVAGAAYTFFFRATSKGGYVAAAGTICNATSQKVRRVAVGLNAPFGARARAAGRTQHNLSRALADIRGLERPEKGGKGLKRFVSRFRGASARLVAYEKALDRASRGIEVKARRESVERRRRRAILRRRRASTTDARRAFVTAAKRSGAAARASGINACARTIELSRKTVT